MGLRNRPKRWNMAYKVLVTRSTQQSDVKETVVSQSVMEAVVNT